MNETPAMRKLFEEMVVLTGERNRIMRKHDALMDRYQKLGVAHRAKQAAKKLAPKR